MKTKGLLPGVHLQLGANSQLKEIYHRQEANCRIKNLHHQKDLLSYLVMGGVFYFSREQRIWRRKPGNIMTGSDLNRLSVIRQTAV